ncbi:MAG: Hsp20/alpha crystallin family protein [Spirochaetales bacterium]|nr:Hsp20/alpha crystallin family protein [Spirochaetales bacterium]
MNLIKYRPITGSLFDLDFERVLDRFFDDSVFTVSGQSHPKVDVRENENDYVVEADIPGFTEKDIDVSVNGDLLTISSKKDETKEEKKKGYIIKERRSTAFSRSFTLPKNIDRDKIDAHFKNGVLSLSLPKTEQAKPKQIDVKKAD